MHFYRCYSKLPIVLGFLVGVCMAKLCMLLASSKSEYLWNSRHAFSVFEEYMPDKATGPDVVVANHEHLHENRSIAEKLYKETRVLCMIMTDVVNYKKRAIHIERTWGSRCNKLLLFMTNGKEETGNASAIAIILKPPNDPSVIWSKTKEAFKYVHEKHLEDFDWFFKADDVTYTIVENLRYLLNPYAPEMPIYFGSKIERYIKQDIMTGDAGYVLSREAVRRFVEQGMTNSEICPHEKRGDEDFEIGKCLESLKIETGSSRDSYGRERFLTLPLEYYFKTKDVSRIFSIWPKLFDEMDNKGFEYCSEFAVTFHFISPNRMYILDYIIYHVRTYT